MLSLLHLKQLSYVTLHNVSHLSPVKVSSSQLVLLSMHIPFISHSPGQFLHE